MYSFEQVVSDAGELRNILGKPHDVVLRKAIDHLDKHCRTYIERSPFLLVATSNKEGNFDISPKGDPSGFVTILDDHTLVVPERLGNKRADTFFNILKNPNVGLIFIIPGKKETLRVSGQARLIQDEAILKPMAIKGKVPQLGLAVHVQEAFFHCAKCMIRSKLWEPEAWPSLDGLPSLAETLVDGGNLKIPKLAVSAGIIHDEKTRLY